jgi:hypothetical protein
MRTYTTTLALLGLLLPPAACLAQEKGAVTTAALERRALVESLPKGSAFRSGGQEYQIVGGVRAVAKGPEAEERQALEAVGAAAADLLEAKGGFLVYREAAGAAPVAARAAAGPGSTLPVAVNRRTGGLGIVLGSLTVRLRDPAVAEAVAREHGLRLTFSAPHLSTAFYQVPQGQDIQAAAAELARDGRVTTAEIEVKEHFAVPQ